MEDFDVDALVGSSGSGNELFDAARMRAEENDVSLTRRVEQKVIVVAADEDYDGPTADMTAANATEEKEGRASLVLKALPDMTPHNGVYRPMDTFTDEAKTLYMSCVNLWSNAAGLLTLPVDGKSVKVFQGFQGYDPVLPASRPTASQRDR